jgi:hypothetical protein
LLIKIVCLRETDESVRDAEAAMLRLRDAEAAVLRLPVSNLAGPLHVRLALPSFCDASFEKLIVTSSASRVLTQFASASRNASLLASDFSATLE